MAPPPPLTPATESEEHWECVTCAKGFSARMDWPYKTADDDSVCKKCIRGIFEQAYMHKTNRPARWGPIELSILDFKPLFLEWFVQGYERQRYADEDEARRLTSNQQSLNGHVPEGWVRGRDYQRCPRCMEAAQLGSGYNHITCNCTMNYCFICGVEALGNSDHWTRGRCPRYNQPGANNAQYDGDDDAVDDAVDDDMDDDDDESDEEWILPSERLTQFSFSVWAWNTTMQTSDLQTQGAMARIMNVSVPRELQASENITGHFGRIYDAMLEHRSIHNVGEHQWDETVSRERQSVINLLPMVAERPPDTAFGPLQYALLSEKVGGVFNMVAANSRRRAYNWAYTRQQEITAHDLDNPLNFAIFDIGPGGTAAEELYAKQLMKFLVQDGERKTEGRIRFLCLERPDGYALCAQITGVGARMDNPLRDIAAWLIVPPPIRLALTPNPRHTPEQRQQAVRIQANMGAIRRDFERQNFLMPFWVPRNVFLTDEDMLIPDRIIEERDYNSEDDGSWDFMEDAGEDDLWPFWDHLRNPALRRVGNPPTRAPRRHDGPREHQGPRRGGGGSNATFGFGAGL